MSDSLLLHVCCAPCMVYPLGVLRGEFTTITAYFYNPNIHPYREFQKRKDCLVEFCEREKIARVIDEQYGMREFLRAVVFHENERCAICYTIRLQQCARFARDNGFKQFSTTLLYSKYQNHVKIIEIGRDAAQANGIEFYYEDFRLGWQQGIEESKKQEMYRQSYCGCIYSEQDRYDKSAKRGSEHGSVNRSGVKQQK